MDVLRELGALGLASRLKRVSDRLYRDVSSVYKNLDLEFEARWFPVLHLLSLHDELAVTEISVELGLSHPAVTQVAAALQRRGLLGSRRDPADERRRLLALTAKGRDLAQKLAPVWRVVRHETERLLAESGVDMLAALDRIEAALDREEMTERVERHHGGSIDGEVELVDYQPEFKNAFVRLNREWLEEYFDVEPVDEELLSDPEGEVIEPGGFILFAVRGGEAVGTVAMIPQGAETFKLTKMCVAVAARGQGIGRQLAVRAINGARATGASRIVLHTSPRLNAANGLYRSLGFVSAPLSEEDQSKYERETIAMVLNLNAPSR